MIRKEKRIKRKFTRDFKIEAAKLVMETSMTQAQVARDLGVRPQLLSRWVDQYREHKEESFPGKGKLRPAEQRLRELERQVTHLTMERDILKKAMAYFAKVPE